LAAFAVALLLVQGLSVSKVGKLPATGFRQVDG
jgi:hypothetical protein